MLEAWPKHPRTERIRKSEIYKTQISLVHDWQRAEHVPWRCAACFTFSHSDEAMSRRRTEPCTPFSGEFRDRLKRVHASHALSAGTCEDGLLVFCARCGNHTTSVFNGLLDECKGPPKGGKRYTARKRLLDGLHPDDGRPFQDIEQFKALQAYQKSQPSSSRG